MCNIIENLIIGFVSGALSSITITAVWSHFEKKKIDKIAETEKKKQYILDFSDNIQILCKYLGRLQLELTFEGTDNKPQNIMRLIESHPATPAFQIGLNGNGKEYLTSLRTIEINIKKDIENQNLSDNKCKSYIRELFQLECKILKNQNTIRKSWEEIKNKI